MRVVTVVLTLLLPALVACSSGTDTESSASTEQEQQAVAAWKTDAEKVLGSDAFDFAALEMQAGADCLRTDVESWTVPLALAGARTATDLTRVGLTHACPKVVDVYDEAVQVVDSTPDPLTLVCAPDVVVSSDDAPAAEMACAGR